VGLKLLVGLKYEGRVCNWEALERLRVLSCEVGWSSVVELTQQRRAALDPVLNRFVGVEQNRQYEVGRMSGCRQNAASLTRLVHRALVSALSVNKV